MRCIPAGGTRRDPGHRRGVAVARRTDATGGSRLLPGQPVAVRQLPGAPEGACMERLPFGISRLDSMIDGGAPAGSVVLLAGEVGAGAREFVYTSVAMNALAHADAELFDLYYGNVHGNAAVPEDIHYISF